MKESIVRSPQQTPFRISARLNNWNIAIEIFAVIISLTIGIISNFFHVKIEANLEKCLTIATLSCTMILIVIRNLNARYFEKAQEARRCGFFDNSFGCRTAICETKKYYDNDDVPEGYKRLLANLHENSIFTSFLSNAMFKRCLPLLLPVFVLVIYLFFVGFWNAVVGSLFLSIFLSYSFIDRIHNLYELKISTEKIEEKCRALWNHIDTLKPEELFRVAPEILELQTSYDVLLSTTKIHLSRKLKEVNNPALMKTWDEYKQRFILRT